MFHQFEKQFPGKTSETVALELNIYCTKILDTFDFFLIWPPHMRRHLFNPLLLSIFQSSYITHYNLQFLMDLCVQLSMYCFVHQFLDIRVLIFVV